MLDAEEQEEKEDAAADAGAAAAASCAAGTGTGTGTARGGSSMGHGSLLSSHSRATHGWAMGTLGVCNTTIHNACDTSGTDDDIRVAHSTTTV